MTDDLEDDLRADARFERLLFWRQILIVAIVAGVIALRAVLG